MAWLGHGMIPYLVWKNSWTIFHLHHLHSPSHGTGVRFIYILAITWHLQALKNNLCRLLKIVIPVDGKWCFIVLFFLTVVK